MEQGVFPLHSIGDTPLPPMYAKLHAMLWSERLVEFSQNLRECYLEKENDKGQKIVKRHLPSLLEVGAPLFPDYTEEEVRMLYPVAL